MSIYRRYNCIHNGIGYVVCQTPALQTKDQVDKEMPPQDTKVDKGDTGNDYTYLQDTMVDKGDTGNN